jgi:hypothetical protein
MRSWGVLPARRRPATSGEHARSDLFLLQAGAQASERCSTSRRREHCAMAEGGKEEDCDLLAASRNAHEKGRRAGTPSSHDRRQMMPGSPCLRPRADAACCLPPGHDEQEPVMFGSRERGSPGLVRGRCRKGADSRWIVTRRGRTETS